MICPSQEIPQTADRASICCTIYERVAKISESIYLLDHHCFTHPGLVQGHSPKASHYESIKPVLTSSWLIDLSKLSAIH